MSDYITELVFQRLMKVKGCGTRFVDMEEGMHIMAGYDNMILGDKSALSGGVDGIKPDDPRFTRADKTDEIDVPAPNEELQTNGIHA